MEIAAARLAMGMEGQWLGRNTGTHPGSLIVNVDEREDRFSGVAIFAPDDIQIPVTRCALTTADKANTGKITADLSHLDRSTLATLSDEDLRKSFSNLIFPSKAAVTYSVAGSSLSMSWTTPIGTNGSANLPRSEASNTSALEAPILSWDQYKAKVDSYEYRRFIFRGQEDSSWRLRTAFHRHGRVDIERFRNEDVPLLYRTLSSRTRRDYDMANPDHFGALIHLAQHYGYPTPLLDWSYSPYVAAFCAFRRVPQSSSSGNIRVLVFDKVAWETHVRQFQLLVTPFLNLTVLEFLSLDNERLIPQQALSTMTNIDDVEAYVCDFERETSKRYLTAIDIDHVERHRAMTDLRRMGITAASMFPGFDGICEELKEQRF